MIEILLEHSYEEDYFMISEVSVNINDKTEKERIEKLVKKHNLEGTLVDIDRGLALRISNLLEVDAKLINFDTEEIDLM